MSGFNKFLKANTNNATSYNDENFADWNSGFIGDSGITNEAIREAIEKGAAIGDKYRAYGKHGAGDRLDLAEQLRGIKIRGSNKNLYLYLEKMSGLTGRDFRRGISTFFDNALTNWDDTYSDSHARFSTIFGMPGTDPKQKTFVGHDPLTAQNKHNAELFDSGRDQFLKARMADAGKNVNYFNGVSDMKGYLNELVSLAELNGLTEGKDNDYIKKDVLANNLYGEKADALLEKLATKIGGDDPFARQAFINNARKTLNGLKGFGKGYDADSFGANVDFGDFQSYLDSEYKNWYETNKDTVATAWDAAHAPVPVAGVSTTNTTTNTTAAAPNNWKGKKGNSYRSGGNIDYFKGGGKPKKSPKKSSSNKQGGIEKQIIGLVQAAMQGDQLATQAIQQVMQAAQSGDQQAVQMAQMILLVIQASQSLQGTTVAKQGTKLGYISRLNMFKNGGHTCSKCLTEKLKCGGKKKLALNGDKLNKISKLCKGKRV